MTARPKRFGFRGNGRSLGPGDQPLVARGEITMQYDVDVQALSKAQHAYMNPDVKLLTKQPGPGGFNLLKDEIAVKLRFGGHGVFTQVGGFEGSIVSAFPDDPDTVRDIMESMFQYVGVVREDARTDVDHPRVTLRIGGSCPLGYPGASNVPGQESNDHIEFGDRIIATLPNLKAPIQYGNEQSGVPADKVMMTIRAASKEAPARRIQNVIAQLLHRPDRFAQALKDFPKIANAWTKVGLRFIQSYKVSFLMGLDLFLSLGIIQVANDVSELLDSGGNALSSQDTVTRIAELIGVLDDRVAMSSLTQARREFWRLLAFNLKHRLISAPNPKNNAYNASYEFGFIPDEANHTWTSMARSQKGEILRTPAGRLLEQQMTHMPNMIQSVVEVCAEEDRNCIGVALSSPSQRGTGRFDAYLQARGGLVAVQ